MAGYVFVTPREIFYGPGALQNLGNLNGPRALVPANVRPRAGLPLEAKEVEALFRHAWNGTRLELG